MVIDSVIPNETGGWANIGDGAQTGSIDVQTGGSLTFKQGGVWAGRNGGDGTITVSGGTLNIGMSGGNNLQIGQGSNADGVVRVTAGTLFVNGNVTIQNGGTSGALDVEGGVVDINQFGALGPVAKVTITGGMLIVRNEGYNLQALIASGKVVAGSGYSLNDIVNTGTQLELTATEFADSDADGMEDTWEDLHFGDGVAPATPAELAFAEDNGDPDDGDASETNNDTDIFTDLQEFLAGSDPNDTASVPGDIDGDGMKDSWELAFFGDLSAVPGDDLDTEDGTPGGTPAPDGFNNLAESKAGTDPYDPDSAPIAGLISINVGGNGALELIDTAGIQGVTNWNNLSGIANPTTSNLIDSLGDPATGMTFAITGGNNSFNALGTSDKRMISSWVQNGTVNLTGIPYSTYDLIIYYDSWAQVSNQNNSIAEYALSSGGGAITSVWGVNQKDFRLEPNVDPDYDEFTATSLADAQAQGGGSASGDGDGGYHLIVTGLTASDLDIVASTVEGTPASICAIQIREAEPAVAFKITSFSLDGKMLTLTWNSVANQSYIVKYSTDLATWPGDLGDGIFASGPSHTETLDITGSAVDGAADWFVRIEEE